jgi:hypothetical protein
MLGEARGRSAVQALSREIDGAIVSLGLTYAAIGRDVGLSGAQVGRIAHGRSAELSIVQASTLLASVGLELSVRAYPTGSPLRDAPQLALLARFRRQLHQALTVRTEVPVTSGFDLRAWDAVIAGPAWRFAVEAETRIRDWQALERRLALKLRDGDVDGLLLVVARTRTNVTIVRSLTTVLVSMFPVPSALALQRLASGADPGGSSLIVL